MSTIEESNDTTIDTGFGLSRRGFVGVGALIGATASVAGLSIPGIARAQVKKKDPKDVKFVFSTPFSGQDSFSGQIGGLNAGVKKYGGTLTITDASFNVKKQNDQIAASVAARPDILIVLPTDPVGCSNAVRAAAESGIPVFMMDSYVVNVTTPYVGMHNDFGMGQLSAQYMAKRLKGKGKIATMSLPINEAWDMRSRGLEYVLRDYPDIKVVADWPLDISGKVTPRAAADSFLASHTDLDAIWCAWDGAGMEAGLAVLAAGRGEKIFTTGIDGGKQAFEVIRSGSPFVFTVAQSFYLQAYDIVYWAHQHLAGKPVPRLVINPAFAVSAAELKGKGDLANDYDKPGVPEKLGWTRAL
jgi:ribose transport system substrate-binding protein